MNKKSGNQVLNHEISLTDRQTDYSGTGEWKDFFNM